MKDIPVIFLMLTIFVGGCLIASVERPFNHDLMKKADLAVNEVITAANMAPKSLQDQEALRPLVDMAWAKYYAGNVSLAKGDTQEAEEFLQDVLELVTQVFQLIKKAFEKDVKLFQNSLPL